MANPTDDTRLGLLQGTLDLLILRTLQTEARHGWSIAERIEQISGGLLAANQGSLYPALHRLERRRLVQSEWATSELGRRARFYRLTPLGRRRLERERADWRRFAGAVEAILEQA